MKKKLKCILLVDDDRGTNYMHEHLIKTLDCSEKVITKRSGLEAIDYLNELDENNPQPEIILLDINMPEMNGWEFLDAYEKLNPTQKAKCVVVMITSSINPDDREQAKTRQIISGFLSKPMTKKMLDDLLREKFPEHY